MKIFFVMTSVQYVRFFESAIELLLARGHELVIGYGADIEATPPAVETLVHDLVARHARLTLRALPAYSGRWTAFTAQMRVLRDYCRYQDPLYRDAQKCAERAKKKLAWRLDWMRGMAPARRQRAARRMGGLAMSLEQIMPVPAAVRRLMEDIRPDVMLVTPLIDLASDQTDYVKAASALGIPTGLCVASWDNLTNKGLIKAEVDRVFVWNEAQKREAVELHGVPPDRIVVTGAQLFDVWFDYRPSRSREEFCRQIGLDPAQPIMLYTGSSMFICKFEAEFVEKWLASLRACDDARLRAAGIVIRPHPKSAKFADQWDRPGIAEAPQVTVFPRTGGIPVSSAARNDYYDSLYHAAAVVGINTSAMLEAGILGRRCFTILADELRDSQEGMVHFQHLMRDGFLVTAASFEEHFRQLAAELDRPGGRTTAFVESFLRPHGLDRPATPIFADAVEGLSAPSAKPGAASAFIGPVLRPLLLPLAFYVRVLVERPDVLRNVLVARRRVVRTGKRLRYLVVDVRRPVVRTGTWLRRRAKRPDKLVRRPMRIALAVYRRLRTGSAPATEPAVREAPESASGRLSPAEVAAKREEIRAEQREFRARQEARRRGGSGGVA